MPAPPSAALLSPSRLWRQLLPPAAVRCAWLAHMRNVAADYEGTRDDQLLLGQWIAAATVAFEAGALVCDAASIVLDEALVRVAPEDRAGFSVEVIRRRAELLAAPGPRLEI